MHSSYRFVVNWYNYDIGVEMTKRIVIDSDTIVQMALDQIGNSLDFSDFVLMGVDQE